MINQLLHTRPVAADRVQHKETRLQVPVTDWRMAAKLNSIFVAATEFGDAARDFPLVFVRAGTDPDGKPSIAPVAVFGVTQQQNLFVDAQGQWLANYMPAVLRMYPFCIGHIDDERFAICFDAGWSGIGTASGERLFTEAGEPTALMKEVQQQLEQLQAQVARTRAMCRRLLDLDLLREMRFDATLPDGKSITVDGFLTVDQDKLNQLDDAAVLELHKTGILGMVHAHYVSLGGMRKLLDMHFRRLTAS